jgi:hypothetical protein
LSEAGAASEFARDPAPVCDRLRSLYVTGNGLDVQGCRAILRSMNLRSLNSLVLNEKFVRGATEEAITQQLATGLTQLPNLVELELWINACTPQVRQIISRSESPPWTMIQLLGEYDVQTWRRNRSPESWPPLDPEWGRAPGEWRE